MSRLRCEESSRFNDEIGDEKERVFYFPRYRSDVDQNDTDTSSTYFTSCTSSSTITSQSSQMSEQYYPPRDESKERDKREIPSFCRPNPRHRHHQNRFHDCSFFSSSDQSSSLSHKLRRPSTPEPGNYSYSHCEESSRGCSMSSLCYSPTSSSFELLPIAFWERSPACREAKVNHMARMDHFCDTDREYLILQTTLWQREVMLETNMFPYDTPTGIEHWTLWCRDEMSHKEVCRYVESWLRRKMPHVRRWNYDDNSGDRSIELFHVHVYIETVPYSYNHRSSFPSPAPSWRKSSSSTLSSDVYSDHDDSEMDSENGANPLHLVSVCGASLSSSDSDNESYHHEYDRHKRRDDLCDSQPSRRG